MLIVAVDIGGTFTDLIGYDTATGRLMSSKSPSTPAGLEQGIHDCLKKAGIHVNGIDGFVHGSTIAINTVLERKGARTALIVTKGTRDVYKIGRGNRPDAYDIWFKRAEPLVPRHLTFEVEERLFATGEVHTPLNVVQAETIAGQVNASGAESVAVCFLHSWNNPIHEQQMAQLLNSKTFRSVSHEILREYGEYERISTTVLNSYIGPKVNSYLAELERMLQEQGFRGNLSVMQSNGGLMSSPVARQLPVAMLESGPVGGFIAAARTGTALGYAHVIGFDMGGTTAKANLARDGEPQMSHGYHIGGYAAGQPMMLPVVDTVEVGSGGGSIAKVDHTGSLKVGPVSAGADPGPACYGKGGTDPTVTDANLLLGRLDPNHFLGGEMALNIEAAREAINRCIARPLGLSETEAARAIVKIAVMNMSLAVRQSVGRTRIRSARFRHHWVRRRRSASRGGSCTVASHPASGNSEFPGTVFRKRNAPGRASARFCAYILSAAGSDRLHRTRRDRRRHGIAGTGTDRSCGYPYASFSGGALYGTGLLITDFCRS